MGPAGFNGIPAALFEREQRCSPAVLPSGVALKLLSLWGGAQQPPPRFESSKAANFIAVTVAWGIFCNRLSAKLELVVPGHVLQQPRMRPLANSLSTFFPSLSHDDESSSDQDSTSESDTEHITSTQEPRHIQSPPTVMPPRISAPPNSSLAVSQAHMNHPPPGACFDPSLQLPAFYPPTDVSKSPPYLHFPAKPVANMAPPTMSMNMQPTYKLGNPPSTRRSYHQDGESTSSDEESDRLARNFAFHEDQLSPQLVAYLCGTLSASDYLHQIVLLSQQGARSRKALMQAVALICDTYGHVYALVPQATPAKPSLIRPVFFMIASPKFPRGTDPRMGKVGRQARHRLRCRAEETAGVIS